MSHAPTKVVFAAAMAGLRSWAGWSRPTLPVPVAALQHHAAECLPHLHAHAACLSDRARDDQGREDRGPDTATPALCSRQAEFVHGIQGPRKALDEEIQDRVGLLRAARALQPRYRTLGEVQASPTHFPTSLTPHHRPAAVGFGRRNAIVRSITCGNRIRDPPCVLPRPQGPGTTNEHDCLVTAPRWLGLRSE